MASASNPPSKRNLESLFDDDEVEPASRRQCVDCSVLAPPQSSNHSLISAKFGWRLSRIPTPRGTRYEWRCPACWQKHRAGGGS